MADSLFEQTIKMANNMDYWTSFFTRTFRPADKDAEIFKRDLAARKHDDDIRKFLQDNLRQKGSTLIGRDLTPDEVNSLIDAKVDTPGHEIEEEGFGSDKTFRNLIQAVVSDEDARGTVKNMVRTRVDQMVKDTFNVDDSTKLVSDEDLEGIITGGDPTKFGQDIATKISALKNAKDTNLMTAYAGEFEKAAGRPPTDAEVDAFLDSHTNDALGLEGVGETEFRAIRDAMNDLTSSVSDEVGSSDAVKEANETAGGDASLQGLTRSQIETKLSEAQDTFAQELASRRGPLEDRLSAAIDKFESAIPEREEQFRGILEKRFKEAIPDIQRNLGEEFTAGVGLKSGAFQRVLGEELSQRQAEIESTVGMQRLGEERGVAEQRLGLEQQLAGIEAGDTERVAALGLGTAQLGADIGRQDLMAELDFQRQLQLAGQQRELSLFLNRLGFSQQQAAQQQQQSYNLGMMGREQSFAAQQNALNRELQREMYQKQVAEQKRQQSQARRQQQTGMLTSLAGGALGAGLGAFAAPALGMTGGMGALLGAGTFGGFPSLSSYATQSGMQNNYNRYQTEQQF